MQPDSTFKWLLANDPEATGKSRRQYAASVSILSPQDELDNDAQSVHYVDAITASHCRCCNQRSKVRGNTVE